MGPRWGVAEATALTLYVAILERHDVRTPPETPDDERPDRGARPAGLGRRRARRVLRLVAGLRALPPATDGAPLADEAIDHVLAGFTGLDVHPDVPAGIRALHDAGFRLVTMTNGSVAVTESLLERAGLRDRFELLLDVHGPRRWKPVSEPYRYVVDAVGVPAAEVMLVAVHPWDVHGAILAGLRGTWVRRGTPPMSYPHVMASPTLMVDNLIELADCLQAAQSR